MKNFPITDIVYWPKAAHCVACGESSAAEGFVTIAGHKGWAAAHRISNPGHVIGWKSTIPS